MKQRTRRGRAGYDDDRREPRKRHRRDVVVYKARGVGEPKGYVEDGFFRRER